MKSRKLSYFYPNDRWFRLGIVVLSGCLLVLASLVLAAPLAHLMDHPEVGLMSEDFIVFIILAAILILIIAATAMMVITTYMFVKKYRDLGKPRHEVHIE